MSMLHAGTAAFAAALCLLPLSPAFAASGITSPGAGQAVTAHTVLPLRAVVEGPAAGPSELSLLAPGADTAEVVAVSSDPDGGELAYDLDTACASVVCPEPAPGANGTWTLRLSGAAEDERTFVLRIRPAVPAEVAADPAESGVRIRWRQGDEPDLRGYRVESGKGAVVRDRIGLDACDAERRCSVEVPEGAGSWTVRAFRATCPDCRDLLASPPSEPVRVQGEDGLLDVPVAQPSAAPQPTSAAPQRRPDQRGAFLGAFGSSRPAVRVPLPRGQAALPALPQAPGAVDQELGYGEQEVVVREPRQPLNRAQDAVGAALGSGDRWRLIGLSVLMIGGSLWLRRWARRIVAD